LIIVPLGAKLINLALTAKNFGRMGFFKDEKISSCFDPVHANYVDCCLNGVMESTPGFDRYRLKKGEQKI